jgi:hypothetical protein
MIFFECKYSTAPKSFFMTSLAAASEYLIGDIQTDSTHNSTHNSTHIKTDKRQTDRLIG